MPLAIALGAAVAVWLYLFPPWAREAGPPTLDVSEAERDLAKDPTDHASRLELARYYLQWGLALSRAKSPMDEVVTDSALVAYFEKRLDEWQALGQDVSRFRAMLKDDLPGFRNMFVKEERTLAKGMFERSVMLYRQARALGATLAPRDLYDLGTAYYHTGPEGYEGAAKFLREAVDNGLVSARALTFLGNVAVARKDYDQGIELYGRALEISGDDPILTFNVALAYKERGDYEKAVELLRKTLTIYQDKQNLTEDELTIILQSRLALGWCLLKLNRHGEAIAQFETLLGAQSDMTEGHYWIGVAYEGIGRLDLARAHWQRVQKIEPGFRDVRDRLAAIARTAR